MKKIQIKYLYLLIMVSLLTNAINSFADFTKVIDQLDEAEEWDVKATVPIFVDELPCEGSACEEKILMGVAFEYESKIKRNSSGTKNIIENEDYFPYYIGGQRKLLTDDEFRNNSPTSFKETLGGQISGKKSGIFFYDGNGATHTSDLNVKDGIYLPEYRVDNNSCKRYRRKLKYAFDGLYQISFNVNHKEYPT